MKREIKFRGKRIGFDKWLYFDMSHHLSDDSGVPPDFLQYQLDVKTIGQFTGLQDKHGVDIYEGDIVKDAVLIFQIEWNTQNAKFCINPINRVNGEFDGIIEVIMYNDLGNGYFSRKDLEIIGSIHTPTELLNP